MSDGDYLLPPDGRLRFAVLPVKASETYGAQVVVQPNKLAPGGMQRLYSGDSGGPCYTLFGELVALNSHHLEFGPGFPDPEERNYLTSVAAFRDWMRAATGY